MKRILIVAYYFPPDENGGTERVKHFYYRLREEGYDTFVLTARKRGDKQEHLFKKDKHVFRLWGIWVVIRAYDGFVRKFGIKIKLFKIVADLLIKIFLQIVRPDVCIASFPLSYDFDIGLSIKRFSNCKLVADFRDGLLFQPFNIVTNGNSNYKKKMVKLEKDIVSDSDLILTVSPEHAQYFKKKYDVSATVIPNGFDHLQIIDCEPIDLSKYGFTVLYTGGLDSSRPGQFQYAKKFFEKIIFDNQDITFIFIGSYFDYELDFFKNYHNVIVYPKQKREIVIATQKNADILLMVTGEDEAGTSGKLFEYLFTSVPIINIGIENNAARIIKECHAGKTISNDQYSEFSEYIEKVKKSEISVTRINTAQYTRQAECHKLAKLISAMFDVEDSYE